MKKPLLAMLVVGAIAIGLLIMLAIGIFTVDEDGREQDGAGTVAPAMSGTRETSATAVATGDDILPTRRAGVID